MKRRSRTHKRLRQIKQALPDNRLSQGVTLAYNDAERQMSKPTASPLDRAFVLQTRDRHDLGRIAEDPVQAVIYEPDQLPAWMTELAQAVESGEFVVPRTVLPCVTAEELAAWLDHHLPAGCVRPSVRQALRDDVLGLTARLSAGTGAVRFMVRLFTAAPTADCGFHVDTVPPSAPAWGILRVYNGAGTDYVQPDNVTSIAEFYRYMSRRERLERDRNVARGRDDFVASRQVEREIAHLDEMRPFLNRPDEVLIAPAGAIVSFKHIEIGLYWTAHRRSKAWIHCSPMRGVPRLVVNVTSPEPARRPAR